jgi:hypothetical protein
MRRKFVSPAIPSLPSTARVLTPAKTLAPPAANVTLRLILSRRPAATRPKSAVSFDRECEPQTAGQPPGPLVFHSQRLALDADLCGGLISGKGARLRIRHRLAPLPLAAPRGAAFAAPPDSPSPIAESRASPPLKGRIVRLAERPQAAARTHPASLNGGIHAAEPPPPLWLR